MAGQSRMERLRELRNRVVWWLEETGGSGMEPSHDPRARVHRPAPEEEVVVFGVTHELKRKKKRHSP